jgi:hypothetical protein
MHRPRCMTFCRERDGLKPGGSLVGVSSPRLELWKELFDGRTDPREGLCDGGFAADLQKKQTTISDALEGLQKNGPFDVPLAGRKVVVVGASVVAHLKVNEAMGVALHRLEQCTSQGGVRGIDANANVLRGKLGENPVEVSRLAAEQVGKRCFDDEGEASLAADRPQFVQPLDTERQALLALPHPVVVFAPGVDHVELARQHREDVGCIRQMPQGAFANARITVGEIDPLAERGVQRWNTDAERFDLTAEALEAILVFQVDVGARGRELEGSKPCVG